MLAMYLIFTVTAISEYCLVAYAYVFRTTKFEFVCLYSFFLITHKRALCSILTVNTRKKSRLTGGLTYLFQYILVLFSLSFATAFLKQGSRIASCNAMQKFHLDTTHPKSFAVCPSRRQSCRPAQHNDCRSWRSEAAPVGLSHNRCQLQRS